MGVVGKWGKKTLFLVVLLLILFCLVASSCKQHEEINNTHLHSFILFGIFIYMLFSFHTLDK